MGCKAKIMQKIIVYGAGGHSKVVIDAIIRGNEYEIIGIIDDNPSIQYQNYYGYKVIGGFDKLNDSRYKNCRIVIAIARNDIRKKLYERLEPLKYELATVIHPSAQISISASIGLGSMIMANAVINPSAQIGSNVVINTGAIVEHDCLIKDFVHIGPGARLAGSDVVGSATFIGIGASVIEFVQIGSNSIICAGSVVIRDIPDNVVAAGIPSRVVKERI